ncbi:unnamed protein product [Debaryomyces tyrocola]|nr:unnamed protein product [Debaryomyces tyrocola]
MYFSGKDINSIIVKKPEGKEIEINRNLFDNLYHLGDKEQCLRVLLDTPLLKFEKYKDKKRRVLRNLVSEDDEDNDGPMYSGRMPFMPAYVYITNLVMRAKFREISILEFKTNYLAPLDSSIKESKRNLFPSLEEHFRSPWGNTWNTKHYIKQHFDGNIVSTIERLYHAINGYYDIFGYSYIIKAVFNEDQRLRTDIMHCRNNKSTYNPEICFALGSYKSENYYLCQGFDDFKSAIKNATRPIEYIFPGREWSPRVVFALTLRRLIYEAFLCGTDRVFISDYETFSGFFKYEIVDDQMEIDYYIITDPETILGGVTLRAAIAGFFFKTEKEALNTRKVLANSFQVACSTKGFDPLLNVLPRPVQLSSKLSIVELHNFKIIEEINTFDIFRIITDEPYWRIIENAVKWYPTLGFKLPYRVVVKLYHYSTLFYEDKNNDLLWFSIPDRSEYYEWFYNELVINEKIAKSQFASKFPKLLVSGYWNGLPDHPMHILESPGPGMLEEKWDKKEVHRIVKLRLEELHLLGISHNDIRLCNIHVSESGKISLINFELSDSSDNEKHKKRDFECLDDILRINDFSGN